MKRWRCTVCNYIHIGENPPEVCPECGVGPEFFELIGEITEEQRPALNEEEINAAKQAVFKISYGIFVVTSRSGDKVNGQVCNTVFQITSDPVRVAASINKQNLTHEYIMDSGVFTVNILGEEQMDLVRRFGFRSGREFDKFARVEHTTGKTGAPVLPEALGYFECKVLEDRTMDAGTHSVFLGEVVGGKLFSQEEPMTYAYYRKHK